MQQPQNTQAGFDTFVVNDGTKAAYEACRVIADLKNSDLRLLLLVGGRGCGKTHLLTAIVDQIRASSKGVGIAYIADGNIPDEVRALLEDPGPVENANNAILLIDDLDKFAPEMETIEALLKLFSDNGHGVVMASPVHPSRLSGFSKELGDVLGSGELIEMFPVDPERFSQVAISQAQREMEEAIQAKDRQIVELSTRLESAEALASIEIDDDAGPEALLLQTVEDLTQELTNARVSHNQFREEIEELRAANALLSVAGKEVGPLRERIKRLEDAGNADSPDEGEQSLAIRHQLEEARTDARKARNEAQGMLKRAEKLIKQMNENRVEFENAQFDQKRHWEEIQKLEEVFTQRACGDIDVAPELVAEQAENAVANLEHEEELEELQLEYGRLQESIVRVHSERDTAKALLERTRSELDETRRDLEKVRESESVQVDDERAKVAPLEHALIEANAEIAALREAQRVVTEELFSLQSQLSEGTGVLERLMHIFGVPDESEVNESKEEAVGVDDEDVEHDSAPTSQADAESPEERIYRADFGEGLGTDTDAPSSLHHVEELDSKWGIPPDSDDLNPPQAHTKSA